MSQAHRDPHQRKEKVIQKKKIGARSERPKNKKVLLGLGIEGRARVGKTIEVDRGEHIT
jgi:hypothetical protein